MRFIPMRIIPMRTLSFFLLFAALIATVGCGGGDSGSSGFTSDVASAPGAASTPDAANEDVTEVTITPSGNRLKYEQTEFTVPAGGKVTLTFRNTATGTSMKHNVVLLTTDKGSVATRVGRAGGQAAGNEYIPEDDAVLAHTALADPGETVTVTFTAPSDPGEYKYLCTYPGHYASMQGTMQVVSS